MIDFNALNISGQQPILIISYYQGVYLAYLPQVRQYMPNRPKNEFTKISPVYEMCGILMNWLNRQSKVTQSATKCLRKPCMLFKLFCASNSLRTKFSIECATGRCFVTLSYFWAQPNISVAIQSLFVHHAHHSHSNGWLKKTAKLNWCIIIFFPYATTQHGTPFLKLNLLKETSSCYSEVVSH